VPMHKDQQTGWLLTNYVGTNDALLKIKNREIAVQIEKRV